MKIKEMDLYLSAYQKDYPKGFKEYVDKYCTKHNITPEEACKHALVVETYLSYLDRPNQTKGEDNASRNTDYSDDRSC